MRRLTLYLLLTLLISSFAACGGGGGGGGGGDNGGGGGGSTPPPPSGTTTVSGSVKLSSTVGAPGFLSWLQAGAAGSPLVGADVKLYDAEKPEWLYPVAKVATDLNGVYSLMALANANLNGASSGGALYQDGSNIPTGNYTIIASNDITVTGGKQYVAVQAYVRKFDGAVVGNDLVAYDSDVMPAVISFFGIVDKNSDGSYGSSTYPLAQNAAIQVTFNMAMARLSVLNAVSIADATNAAVQGRWKVSADLLSATFYPAAQLTAGLVYTVTVAGTAQNVFGKTIPATVVGHFQAMAVDTTPPNAIPYAPLTQTDVPITTPIRIASNEVLDMNTFSVSGAPSIGAKPLVIYAGLSDNPLYKYVYEIMPAGVLQLNTDYAITVSGAKDMAGNKLTPLTYNFKTEAVHAAPTVVSTSPSNNATGIALNPVISVTFSGRMDPLTLTGSTFTVTSGGASVAGAVNCNGTTATFVPSTPFTYGTVYTVTITSGAQDIAGTAPASSSSWSFTTLTNTPPVTTATPAGGLYGSPQSVTLTADKPATIYFTTDGSSPLVSSPVYTAPITIAATTTLKFFGVDVAGNTESVEAQSYIIDATAPAGAITINGGALRTNSAVVTLTLNATDANGMSNMAFSTDGNAWLPTEAYATSRTFTLPTGDGSKTVYVKFSDKAGNWSSSANATIILDTTPPTVASTSPADGAPNVGVNSTISVTLSENIDASLVTAATFTVMKGGTPVQGTVTASGNLATFTPTNSLDYSTTYSATINTGVKDLAGNPLAANKTWTFTTAAIPIPAAPSVVNAACGNATTGYSCSQLTITWSPVTGAASYNVYWATSPGVTTNSSGKALNQTSPYLLSGSDQTKYYIVVTAANGFGESVVSTEVNATITNTPPLPPGP